MLCIVMMDVLTNGNLLVAVSLKNARTRAVPVTKFTHFLVKVKKCACRSPWSVMEKKTAMTVAMKLTVPTVVIFPAKVERVMGHKNQLWKSKYAMASKTVQMEVMRQNVVSAKMVLSFVHLAAFVSPF